MRHIAVTERLIWAETVHNRPVAYTTHGRELADGREAVLAFLDRLHEESLPQFRMLTPAMLDEKCITPAGVPLTTWKWLRMMPERNPPPRPALHDAQRPRRADAADLRHDGFRGATGQSEI